VTLENDRVTDIEKGFYEQITDIDGNGAEETIQILKNTDIDEESVQVGHYILAIFDETGTARYAEYTYDFFSSTPPRILDIADLDGDGISEIILENVPASNATAAAGFQSLSRFIYKYDDSIGQFTNVSNLGRFLRNEAVADYDVYINDFITGLGYTFSYEEAVKNPENEGHLNDLIDFGIIDEIEEGLADDFVEKTHGVQRYQYVSALENIEDGTTGVIYEDPVYPMRWLTLNATLLYEYNPNYDWLEIVGMDGAFNASTPVEKSREVFSLADFNDRFEMDMVSMDDYFGEWTRVTDGRLQEVNHLILSIDAYEIKETNTENAGVMGHNTTIDLETAELDENTNQMKVTGEVIENDALDVNNKYDNTFTILYIEGTKHMIDKYGDFYLQL